MSRVVAVCCLLVLLAGCSSKEHASLDGELHLLQPTGATISRSFDELIQAELARPDLSGFEYSVLTEVSENGELSQAQYEEGYEKYVDCLGAEGSIISHEKLDNGLYRRTYTFPYDADDSEIEAAMVVEEACARGTIAVVEALYRTQVGNPDLIASLDEIASRCLVVSGVVDDGYEALDLQQDWKSGFENASFDPMESAAQLCFSSAGMAVAVD